MKLTYGLKEAAAMGAHEVLEEWLPDIARDPGAVLRSDDLGSTHLSLVGPETVPDHDARQMLTDLAPWDVGDEALTLHQRVAASLYEAGIDFARALITLATGEGAVPPRVLAHAWALAPVADALKDAIAKGSFDGDLDALLAEDVPSSQGVAA